MQGLLLVRAIAGFVSRSFGGYLARIGSGVFDMLHKRNKALEPTSTAVTLRAIVSSSEMKPWTDNPLTARSAPAAAVAHL